MAKVFLCAKRNPICYFRRFKNTALRYWRNKNSIIHLHRVQLAHIEESKCLTLKIHYNDEDSASSCIGLGRSILA